MNTGLGFIEFESEMAYFFDQNRVSLKEQRPFRILVVQQRLQDTHGRKLFVNTSFQDAK